MAQPQTNLPKTIIKRDGSSVPFETDKIFLAIKKAMVASGEFNESAVKVVVGAVEKQLIEKIKADKNFVPTVESVQDEVETELMTLGYSKTAKAYILFRAKRAEKRIKEGYVPKRVRELAKESKKYFKGNELGEFVYLRTYARWIEREKRRETWIETVARYIDFMKENLGDKLKESEYEELREAILKQEVMPSMRLMQFAGEPARRCNACAYNCSFIAPSAVKDFAEIMYLSMQGCGVGFTVESQNIEQLPQIQKQNGEKLPTHTVADSKEGWCDALTLALDTWYRGGDIDFDYSEIRKAGSRLKVMGGKASGPDPLISLLDFAKNKILSRQGRRLRSIDAHDIICKIGECVVSGGVRRTAMISLSDLDDVELRDAKKGQFFLTKPHRSIANNSAVYEAKPSSHELMEEWVALMKSGSGERGIFNRGSIENTLPERRKKYFKKVGFYDKSRGVEGPIGTNPCGEIILQSKQFCNLSEIIARKGDDIEILKRKARLAAILGTYQSTLTNFKYISKDWKKHCKEESLLGVSITGQWDCKAAREKENLRIMRDTAIEYNKKYAKRFGVNPSNSVTAVKPSGTVSQTFDCSSGIHPRHSKYYIRRVRISGTDSLYKMLRDQGVPFKPEVGQTEENATTFVLEFPVKSPGESVFKDDQTALEQLNYWKKIKLNYTEHNPSATISVGEDEWIGVIDWIQKNWDIIGGLSFLPRADHVYKLAPYEEIDKKIYEEKVDSFPKIDYSKLVSYEHTDETEQKKELACAGGTCDVDMVVPTTEEKVKK
jgi:ribonucleoside-diphosphate reductase alpha chain